MEGQVEVVDHVPLGPAALVPEEAAEGLRLQLRLILVEVASDGAQLLGHRGRTLIIDADLGVVGVRDQVRDPREVLLVADVQVGHWDIGLLLSFGIGEVNLRPGLVIIVVIALRGASGKLRVLLLHGKWGLLLGPEGRGLLGALGAHQGCHDGRQLQVGGDDPSLRH